MNIQCDFYCQCGIRLRGWLKDDDPTPGVAVSLLCIVEPHSEACLPKNENAATSVTAPSQPQLNKESNMAASSSAKAEDSTAEPDGQHVHFRQGQDSIHNGTYLCPCGTVVLV